MAEEKPRLARLSAIITQLQSKRMITAREIAEKHGVSIRTIYRDIRTLEKSGIPIVTEEGKGFSIMEGYKIPPVMFTEEEANALITAGYLVRQNKDQSLVENHESAITKIKAVLQYNQKDKVELLSNRIQVRNNYYHERTSNYLIQLQSTISNYQLVEIKYTSVENQTTQRAIEPFALYTTRSNWILIAFCRNRQDFRAFRLDRIQELQVTNQHFEPHKMTLEEYLESCRKKIKNTHDTPLTHDSSIFASKQNKNMQNVEIEPFNMIGISVRTSNQNGQAANDIQGLWQKFMTEGIAANIPAKVDDTVYSLYTEYEGDHNKPYTAFLGCKVSNLNEIPEGMTGKSFDGGKYVKLTARGNLMQGLVVNQWLQIWEMGLNRAYTADFEVFGEKAQNPDDAEVDFLIAVN